MRIRWPVDSSALATAPWPSGSLGGTPGAAGAMCEPQELPTAPAHHHVLRLTAAVQRMRHVDQGLVAHEVPEAVVEPLEVIDVDHQRQTGLWIWV